MLRTLTLAAICLVILAVAGTSCHCAIFYHAFEWTLDGSCTDLGTLSGGTNSWAYSRNLVGQTTGWSTNSFGETRAVRWEADGSIVDLGSGIGYSINSHGQVAGESDGRAVLWHADGSMHDIGPGSAQGVNDLGQVVGSMTVTLPGGLQELRGFVWTLFTGQHSLGKLPGTVGSTATGINSSGCISGTSFINDDHAQAAYWTDETGWTTLGDGSAVAINDGGQIAGNAVAGYGFLWSPATGLVPGPAITVKGLNSAGQVVGYTHPSGGNPHAVLWVPGSDAVDLGVPDGYLWSKAFGINDNGEIVGAALYVPEPSSLAALALGLGGLVAGVVRGKPA